jgi:phage RecT family recombinase
MSVDKILSLVDIAGSKLHWEQYVKSVKNSLPSQFRKDEKRYFSIYVQIMQEHLNNPKVTNKKSIFTCMFNAPKLGLNPDKVFGHIWFIPYKGVLTYQIGYKGMIQMSLNSGKVINVRSGLVYENDEWDFYEDENGQHYLHKPNFKVNRGQEVCGYSIFTDRNRIPNIHVMESAHIEEIKKMVLARMGGSSTPWKDKLFEPEMRKKTVVRRHWKYEPMSAEIAEVIENEERNEAGDVPSQEEQEKAFDDIMNLGEKEPSSMPDPKSEEGKKLAAELDAIAANQEALPFK